MVCRIKNLTLHRSFHSITINKQINLSKTRMKIKLIIASLFISLGLGSCIREEALNTEADIESCILPEEILKMNPIIGNKTVVVMAKPGTDITTLAPDFTLTPGATIYPPKKTQRDFSTPQTYTVTSQDGVWKKEYTIYVDTSDINTRFSFEHWETIEGKNNKKWHGFYEITDQGQKQTIWATANAGYSLTNKNLTDPLIYPTVSYELGYSGKGVKLETKSTGAFGEMIGMPIAAGNLFLGSFDVTNAAQGPQQALKATLFGLPMSFNRKPIAFNVWYQFTPGEVYTDENKNIIEGKQDICDMYAILYEPRNGQVLDGSIRFDDECIVGIARIDNPQPASTYKYVSIPFEYRKEVDREKLATGEYYMAIVFSSSREGAYFKGAVGSTLIIDEAELQLEGDPLR